MAENERQSSFSKIAETALVVGAGAVLLYRGGGSSLLSNGVTQATRFLTQVSDDVSSMALKDFDAAGIRDLYRNHLKGPDSSWRRIGQDLIDNPSINVRPDSPKSLLNSFTEAFQTLRNPAFLKSRIKYETVSNQLQQQFFDANYHQGNAGLQDQIRKFVNFSVNKFDEAVPFEKGSNEYIFSDSVTSQFLDKTKFHPDTIDVMQQAIINARNNMSTLNGFDNFLKDLETRLHDTANLAKQFGSLDNETTFQKFANHILGDRPATIDELLAHRNNVNNKNVLSIDKDKGPMDFDIKDILDQLQNKRNEIGKSFGDLYVDNAVRVNKKGEVYSMTDAASTLNKLADGFANTLPGKLTKMRDILYVKNPNLWSYFGKGKADPILASYEKTGKTVTKDRYMRIFNKMYRLTDDFELEYLPELDNTYTTSGKHGTIPRIIKNISGDLDRGKGTSFKFLNDLDILTSSSRPKWQEIGSIFKKFKDPNWGRNLINSFLKTDKDEFIGGLMAYDFGAPEGEQFLQDYFSRVSGLNKVLSKVIEGPNRRTVRSLYNSATGGSKDVLEMYFMKDSELIERLGSLNNRSGVKVYHNYDLMNMARNLASNTRSSKQMINITSDNAPIVSSTITRHHRELLNREILKEAFLQSAHGDSMRLGAINQWVERAGIKGAQKDASKDVANWAVLQSLSDVFSKPKRQGLEIIRDNIVKTQALFSSKSVSGVHSVDEGFVNSFRKDMSRIAKDKFYTLQKGFNVADDFFNQEIVQGNNFGEEMLMRKAVGPGAALKSLLSLNDTTKAKAFVKQFYAGRNNMQDVTTATLFPYFSLMRLVDPLGAVGLNFSARSTGSVGDLAKNIALKRVLPIAGVMTAYSYLNDESRNFTGTSINGALANNLANIDLGFRRVQDAIGIGGIRDRGRAVNPMAQYLFGSDYQTYDERKQWYESGYSPVRKGRYWSFGSSSEFRGGKIDYFQPNYLVRAHSDWYNIGVYGSSDEKWAHSLIPTPTHPLSTLRYLADPYWLERCVVEGTKIVLQDGSIKLIEDITPGDVVFTHTGSSSVVENSWSEEIDENIIQIQTALYNGYDVESTPEHRYYAIKTERCPKRSERESYCIPNKQWCKCKNCQYDFSSRYRKEWLRADELKSGDYIAYPKPKLGETLASLILPKSQKYWNGRGFINGARKSIPNTIAVTPDLFRMFGYYIAEGHSSGRSVVFTFADDELEYCEEIQKTLMNIFGIEAKIDTTKMITNHTIIVRMNNSILAKWFLDMFGHRAENKKIPTELLDAPKDCLIELINGFYRGDGTCKGYDTTISSVTISEQLANQLKHILMALGYLPSINIQSPSGERNRHYSYKIEIHGNEANELRRIIGWPVNKDASPSKWSWRDDDYYYIKVKKTTRLKYQGKIYDLKIKGAHSFATVNAILHNTHYWDRPYPVSGKMFEEGSPWGAILNPTVGELIKPIRRMHENELQGTLVDVRSLISNINAGIHSKADSQGLIRLKGGIGGSAEPVNFTAALSPDPSEQILNLHISRGKVSASYLGNGGANVYPTLDLMGYDQIHDIIQANAMGASEGLPGAPGSELGSAKQARLSFEDEIKIQAQAGSFFANIVRNYIPKHNVRDYISNVNGEIKARAQSKPPVGVITPNSIYTTQAKNGLDLLLNGESLADIRNVSSTNDFLQDASYSSRELGGIYGFLFDELGGTSRRSKLQGAGRMSSFSRQFWDASVGGVGGEFMEIARRFFPHEDHSINQINPLKNTMPDWMPARFRQGDPYQMLPKGEMRLPGAGYESIYKLHSDMYGRYGAFDRFKILADIAPWSQEYKVWRSLASKTTQDPILKAQMKEIRKRVQLQSRTHEFYPYKFRNLDTESKRVVVDKILTDNKFSIIGDDNVYRLAGISVKRGKADPGLDSFLKPGMEIKLRYDTNKRVGSNPDRSVNAVVYTSEGNLNKYILKQGAATEREDGSAAGIFARYSQSQIDRGRVYETLAHLPVPFLHDKFMRVNSPLESYKDEQIYGVPFSTWSHPIQSMLIPAFQKGMAYGPMMQMAGLGAGFLAHNVNASSAGKGAKLAANLAWAALDRGAFVGGLTGFVSTIGGKYIKAGMYAGTAIQLAGYLSTRSDKPIDSTLNFAMVGAILAKQLNFRKIGVNIGIGKGALIGAATGLAISVMKNPSFNKDKLFGVYIPERVQKKREMIEYFDRLKYIKYMGLYEKAAREAKSHEGIDIKRLLRKYERDAEKRQKIKKQLLESQQTVSNSYPEGSPEREELLQKINERLKAVQYPVQILKAGQYTRTALAYKQAAESTIYGLSKNASYAQLMRSVDKNDRDYILEFAKERDPKKQKEILKYMSPYERRVLQTAWGQEPDSVEDNTSFFTHHKLPGLFWAGWRPDTNLDNVEMKTIQNEGMLLSDFGFYESQAQTADAERTQPITNFNHGSGPIELRKNLLTALTGAGLIGVDVNIQPSSDSGIQLVANIARITDYKIKEGLNATLGRIFY